MDLRVLYTHQKTKKKKVWKDGRIKVTSSSCSLYDATPIPGSSSTILDTIELSQLEIQSLVNGSNTELESEKYLITIEGPWVVSAVGDNDIDGGSGNC